jgi:hypothetical protein
MFRCKEASFEVSAHNIFPKRLKKKWGGVNEREQSLRIFLEQNVIYLSRTQVFEAYALLRDDKLLK